MIKINTSYFHPIYVKTYLNSLKYITFTCINTYVYCTLYIIKNKIKKKIY